jgi:hypothetical protein
MFVGAFLNGLMVRHFNESLAQKPATITEEIMKCVECYIKGEESYAKKRYLDIKETKSQQAAVSPFTPKCPKE